MYRKRGQVFCGHKLKEIRNYNKFCLALRIAKWRILAQGQPCVQPANVQTTQGQSCVQTLRIVICLYQACSAWYAVVVVRCWIAAAYPAFFPRVGALDCYSPDLHEVTGVGAGDSRTIEWSARAAYNTDSQTVRIVQYTRSHITYAVYRHYYSLCNGTYEGYGMLSQSVVQICLLSSLLRVTFGVQALNVFITVLLNMRDILSSRTWHESAEFHQTADYITLHYITLETIQWPKERFQGQAYTTNLKQAYVFCQYFRAHAFCIGLTAMCA